MCKLYTGLLSAYGLYSDIVQFHQWTQKSRVDIWHIPFQSVSAYFIQGMDNFWIFFVKEMKSHCTQTEGIITCQLIKKDVKLIRAPFITNTYGKNLENVISFHSFKPMSHFSPRRILIICVENPLGLLQYGILYSSKYIFYIYLLKYNLGLILYLFFSIFLKR